jgi:hypothetical protein
MERIGASLVGVGGGGGAGLHMRGENPLPGVVVDGGRVGLGHVELEVPVSEHEQHPLGIEAEPVVAQAGALHVPLLVGAEALPLEALPL